MKRIQAQRKFAQGVPIPSNNCSTPERRVDIAPGKEETTNIHSNTSVKILLDIVSFSHIHGHKVPVVVLERLKMSPALPIKINEMIKELEKTDPKKITNTCINGDTRYLRSQNYMEVDQQNTSEIPNGTNLKEKEPDKNEFYSKLAQPTPRKLAVNTSGSSGSSMSAVSLDEDIPLIHLAEEKKKRNTKKTKVKNSSISHNSKILKRTAGKKKKGTKTRPSEASRLSNSMTLRSAIKKDECKTATQVKQYLQEICSISNENERAKIMSKVLDIVSKIVSNTSTLVPMSSQQTGLSQCSSENRTNLNEVLQPESNGCSESCVECRDLKNIIKLKELADEAFKNKGSYESFNFWEEQYSLDLNVLRKGILEMKFCTNTKTKKTKPVVVCTLASKPSTKKRASANKGNETQYAYRDIVEYMWEYFYNLNKSNDERAEESTSAIRRDDTSTVHKEFTSTSNLSRSPVATVSSQIINENVSINSLSDSPSESVISQFTQEDKKASESNKRASNLILTSQPRKKRLVNVPLVEVNETRPESRPTMDTRQPCNSRNETRAETSTKRTLLEAPVFTPTAAEFSDPVAYFNSIMPKAKEFGICKVVPPVTFIPECHINEEMVFNATNQYIPRLFKRWGEGSREMSTIKAYLASQSVLFKRAPLYEGMEVNLPKLYKLVQLQGGLKNVIEKKRWSRVAEEMRFTKRLNPEKKLDQLYVKYLLPYDTLSHDEREEITSHVERVWRNKYSKMLERALNPLQRQARLLSGCDSSEEDDDSDEDEYITGALAEAEECVVLGRKMNLATFRKVAETALDTYFTTSCHPKPSEVEQEYWRLVQDTTDHVCVNSASIDTGSGGYGFTTNTFNKYGSHPWNLKMLMHNDGNILRYLGPVLGVTIPTLHLGMVFSTSCWHRDPHSLPWMEFMHMGPPKIWYGIPDEQSEQFRKAVEALCPTSCQNKSMWLPSDITMIPPQLLLDHNVSLSRVEQKPGEYIFVFPKAYSSSICTGFTISESVYFATLSWLQNGLKCFSEAQLSCEPTMISEESFLISLVMSDHPSHEAILPSLSILSCLLFAELHCRDLFEEELVDYPHSIRYLKHRPGNWNVREQDECEVCRKTLYLSQVRGLTKNNTSFCLQHAIQIIRVRIVKGIPVPAFELNYYFYKEEIYSILGLGNSHIRMITNT